MSDPDSDVFKIPFSPDDVKRLEKLGFKKTDDEGSTYHFDVLLNAWEDNETGLEIEITMWNGNIALAIGEDDDRKELFSLQGPPDYVIGKLEPILPKLKEKQADQHQKNLEKWAIEGEPLLGGGKEDINKRRFKIDEIVKGLITESLKDSIEIVPARRDDIIQFVQKHYLQKFPQGIHLIYMVNYKEGETSRPIGMAMYGTPFPTSTKFLSPVVDHQETTELKRLFLDDIDIPNLESFVIAKTLKKVKEDRPNIKVVLTYADEEAGHVGSIYQATNAIYLGKSKEGKHKYIYILRGDTKAIKAKLEPQEYPKKAANPKADGPDLGDKT